METRQKRMNLNLIKTRECTSVKQGIWQSINIWTGVKKKTYSETLKSDAHSKQAEFQETEHFKEKMKERYKIEAKTLNGSLS